MNIKRITDPTLLKPLRHALAWFAAHTSDIHTMIDGLDKKTRGVKPEDIENPSSWKATNWKWFLSQTKKPWDWN